MFTIILFQVIQNWINQNIKALSPFPTHSQSPPAPGRSLYLQPCLSLSWLFFSTYTVQYVYLCLFLGLVFYSHKLFMLFWNWCFPLNNRLEIFFMCQQSRCSLWVDQHSPGPASVFTAQHLLLLVSSPAQAGAAEVKSTLCIDVYSSLLFIWTAVWCSTAQSWHFMKLCTIHAHLSFSSFSVSQTKLPL